MKRCEEGEGGRETVREIVSARQGHPAAVSALRRPDKAMRDERERERERGCTTERERERETKKRERR